MSKVDNKVPALNAITLAKLNSYYEITSNIGNTLASQAVFECIKQNYSPADLKQFEADNGVPEQDCAYDIGFNLYNVMFDFKFISLFIYRRLQLRQCML
jgi:hypothetical protein